MIVLVSVPVFAFVGWAIGAFNPKLRGGEGFILSPIGWVVVPCLGPSSQSRRQAKQRGWAQPPVVYVNAQPATQYRTRDVVNGYRFNGVEWLPEPPV
jgi:hypothetical protein